MRRVLEEQAEDEDMEPGGADPFGTGVSIFYSTDQGVPPGTVFMESVYKTAIVATDTGGRGLGGVATLPRIVRERATSARPTWNTGAWVLHRSPIWAWVA